METLVINYIDKQAEIIELKELLCKGPFFVVGKGGEADGKIYY